MSQQVNYGRSGPDNDREGDSNVREDALATYSRNPPRNISMDRDSARTMLHEVRHMRRRPAGSSPPWKLPEDQDREEQRRATSADDERQARRRRRRDSIECKDSYRVKHYDDESDQGDDLDPHPSHHYRHRHSAPHRSRPALRVEQTPPPDFNTSGPLTPYNHNRELIRTPRRHSRSRRSSSSSSSSSSDAEYDSHEAEKRAARNKKILYTGLATMTTLSAANGIYQVTKGYHGRRNAHKEGLSKGEWDDAERKKQRNKRLMMDGLAAVTLAIGANNVRIGWQRREEKRKAHEEAERKAHEKRMARREERYTVEELRSH